MPIKGASPNKGAPIVWKNPITSYLAKIYVVSLIIVRLDMVLLERPAPLLGRIRTAMPVHLHYLLSITRG